MHMEIRTFATDLAKSVPQLHSVDAEGGDVLRRKLRPAGLLDFLGGLPSCLIDVEACAGAHRWAREIADFVRASAHAPQTEKPETWPPPQRSSRHQISTCRTGASRHDKA